MDLTTIFCLVDDFCKLYQRKILAPQGHDLKCNPGNSRMTMSEIITVLIYYGACSQDIKTFKAYYKYEYSTLISAFPELLSYERLVELKQAVIQPMAYFLILLLAPCDGITFSDSTPVPACHIKRERSHKVLKRIAKKGKSTNGWFYGTKLHLAVNSMSIIVTLCLSPGNVADNNADLLRKFAQKLWGKMVGDKGYIINSPLWEELYRDGLQIIHGLRSNMANKLISVEDKLLKRKRSNISEGVFSKLKDRMSLVYTKTRSVYGFLSHILGQLTSYQLWAYERAACSSTKPKLLTITA